MTNARSRGAAPSASMSAVREEATPAAAEAPKREGTREEVEALPGSAVPVRAEAPLFRGAM